MAHTVITELTATHPSATTVPRRAIHDWRDTGQAELRKLADERGKAQWLLRASIAVTAGFDAVRVPLRDDDPLSRLGIGDRLALGAALAVNRIEAMDLDDVEPVTAKPDPEHYTYADRGYVRRGSQSPATPE